MELFKFMPYREDFFCKRLLRFTPVSGFNDPFEANMALTSVVASLYGRLKHIDGENVAPEKLEHIYNINGKLLFGVLSLTKSKHSLLMWAHYAASHTGIVIGLNSEHQFFNQPITVPGISDHSVPFNNSLLGKPISVNYDRVRLEMTSISDLGNLQEFFHKSDEWAYEKEYRMLVPLHHCREKVTTSSGDMHFLELPEDAITRVILGCRCDKEKVLNDFSSACDTNPKLSHIKIEAAELDKDLFHINHVSLVT